MDDDDFGMQQERFNILGKQILNWDLGCTTHKSVLTVSTAGHFKAGKEADN